MQLRRILSVGIFFSLAVLLSGCTTFGSKPAGIQVLSNVPTTVIIDAKEVGSTPYKAADLPIKKYAIKLTPNDPQYQPHELSLKLFGGYETFIDWTFGKTKEESQGFTFEYEAAQDSKKAELQLTAAPDNVPVAIDGKNVGFTPLLIDALPAGEHTVRFMAPGYQDAERTLKLIEGVRVLLTVKMAKLPEPAATPLPVSTESATLEKTASAAAKKATPKPTPSPTPKPQVQGASTSATVRPSASPVASASAAPATGVKKTTTTKPYVEIGTTPTGFLRVRSSPEVSTSNEVFKLADGSTVPYATASTSGWLKVLYDGSSAGWVSTQYAKLVP